MQTGQDYIIIFRYLYYNDLNPIIIMSSTYIGEARGETYGGLASPKKFSISIVKWFEKLLKYITLVMNTLAQKNTFI